MSRGPGALQREVLARLPGPSQTPANTGELGWTIAAALGRIDVTGALAAGVRRGTLRSTFYKAYRRALARLRDEGLVILTKRRLRTYAELVSYYPARTARVEVRELRQALLPHLVAISQQRAPVTDHAELERSLLSERLSADDALASRCARVWRDLNDHVARALVAAPSADSRDTLLRLLVAGARYFDSESAFHHSRAAAADPKAFLGIIDAAEPLLAPAAAGELRALYRLALPIEPHRERLLKDVLFRVAEFHRDRRQPVLKDVASRALLEAAPTLVRALPGFAEATGPRRRRTLLDDDDGSTDLAFNPEMERLLDRHVFDQFEFAVRAA